MQRFCDAYIRHVRLIGALYCILPVVAWFVIVLVAIPFRSVYALRLVLAVIGGGYLGARANEYGLGLWLLKHRSPAGPAGVTDGAIIGAGIGLAAALLPPLLNPIGTNHAEEARLAVILVWLGSLGLGALVGATLAAIGRRHLARSDSRPPGASLTT